MSNDAISRINNLIEQRREQLSSPDTGESNINYTSIRYKKEEIRDSESSKKFCYASAARIPCSEKPLGLQPPSDRKSEGDREPEDRGVSRPEAGGLMSAAQPISMRQQILSKRRLITEEDMVYMCLSLESVKKLDRIKVNCDWLKTGSTKFNQLRFRLQDHKPSEYYANLKPEWTSEPAYANAWSMFNDLRSAGTKCWIGKACIRNKRSQHAQKLVGVPLTSMVVYVEFQGETQFIKGTLWIEDAEVDFVFDRPSTDARYDMKSEPIERTNEGDFEIIDWE